MAVFGADIRIAIYFEKIPFLKRLKAGDLHLQLFDGRVFGLDRLGRRDDP